MTCINTTSNVPVDTNGEYPKEDLLDPFLSDEALRVIETIFYAGLTFTCSIMGAVGNVVSIIVFFKQGFKDSINISLSGLSISDLCVLSTFIWMGICSNPMFQQSDIEFDYAQVQYITADWPSVGFSRMNNWITACITFEKCVCIALPMKVKDIITPKRTFISIVVIFLLIFASVSPVFFSVHFATSFNIERNKTLLGFSYSNNAAAVENLSYSINTFSQLCSCILVIVCTITLIYNLQVKSKWRQKAIAVSSLPNSDSLTSRDKRVMKMVASVSCIFIVCYFPSTLNMILAVHFYPDYSVFGRYQNLFQVSWAMLSILEAVNSSANIIVYYNMSSKFRTGFKRLFSADDVAR